MHTGHLETPGKVFGHEERNKVVVFLFFLIIMISCRSTVMIVVYNGNCHIQWITYVIHDRVTHNIHVYSRQLFRDTQRNVIELDGA